MKLNICCADKLLEGYVNVDIVTPEQWEGYSLPLSDWHRTHMFQSENLNQPWPWQTSSVEEVFAYDAIEHMPNPVLTMNEAWRVLKPGGQLNIDVPTTDGRAAWQDPGHVSFWNRNSFWYYEVGNAHWERFRKLYGIKAAFKVLDEKERVGALETFGPNFIKLWILLEAVKSA